MSKSATTSGKQPPRGTPPSAPKRLPVWPILIGAMVVAAVIAVLLSSGSGGGGDDSSSATDHETAPVKVTGAALPEFVSTKNDDAVGDTAPTLTGSNFSGASVTIPAADGNAKAIFFVAHWCPHCQAEIPRLSSWIKAHGIPAGVDIDIVSTRVNEASFNSPASAWLKREGVSNLTTMVDSDNSDAYGAYGAGGLPYIVYLDNGNEVVLRTEGEYGSDPEVYTNVFRDLAAGDPVANPQTSG
jgi:cytochrome c biogenesis protein CcmG/thiol:disulfide interchange protein DsbE